MLNFQDVLMRRGAAHGVQWDDKRVDVIAKAIQKCNVGNGTFLFQKSHFLSCKVLKFYWLGFGFCRKQSFWKNHRWEMYKQWWG